MIELPEALTLAKELNGACVGKRVARVLPPTREHKFCWYTADPAEYDGRLRGRCVTRAEGFGIFAQVQFEGGEALSINDGVNLRLIDPAKSPASRQIMIEFEDGEALCFTVAMYGGITLHHGEYDNDFYRLSREAMSPFDPEFPALFRGKFATVKPSLSAKGFLATQQRFPGIGNGVTQDILLSAELSPRARVGDLSEDGRVKLLESTITVLREMVDAGGRDTEKDLFGNPGGYRTKMCKNTLQFGCPNCGGHIRKEAYLGGSVYYCAACQKERG